MTSATPMTNTELPANRPTLDVERIREDFPILRRIVNGKPLVYLDSAATTQKPQAVMDAISAYYTGCNANVHRGVHQLSVEATEAYEGARGKVQRFIGASRPEEIVFCRGATEAINLVAQSYGRTHLAPGDEIVVSHMEHHSNIVPWQILCQQTGAVLRVAPINDAGELLWDEFSGLLTERTKLVAMIQVSNALGTINPVKRIVEAAHACGAKVLIDGAQSVPHLAVDVQHLDCDFFVFSGHKVFGPTGIGALYGKMELLDAMPPYQGGGEMIKSVSFAETQYNDVPHKFEAGTPNIAGSVGLGTAIDYLSELGLENVAAYERELLAYATARTSGLPGFRLIGSASNKASVLSFVIDGVHPHDVGTILDQQGIAIRTGHHCAQPVMQRFDLPATARASMAFYNTRQEVDALVSALGKVVEVFT